VKALKINGDDMKRLQALGVVLAAALALTACSTGGNTDNKAASPNTSKPIAVHVAETAGVPSAFLGYGVQKGFFEKEGLDLTVDTGAGGAAAIPGIISGATQLAGSNTVSVVLAKSKGLPLQIVAPGTFAADNSDNAWSAVLVRKDSPIQGPQDLAGKTIAVNTLQNIGDVTIKSSLEKAGVDVSGNKFIELGFPDMLAALSAGNADAVWEIEPFVTAGRAAGDRPVLWPYEQAKPGLMIGSFVASDDYIAKNPKVIDAFRRGINATVESVTKDPDAFRAALPGLAKIPEASAKAMRLPTWKTSVDLESLKFVEERMRTYGIISNKVDVSALLAK
jgi:NitT/TauT family transport system substrate-binding protein